MPRVVSDYKNSISLNRRYIPIFAITLLLIFHTLLIAFINSSFLEQFIKTESIGTIYIVGSSLSILIFLFISKILTRVGNLKLTLALLVLNGMAVVGMAFAETLRVAIPLFIVHLIAIPLIVFNLDVFMEEHIGNNEGVTGTRRGLLLTLMSLVSAFSPFISGELVAASGGSFSYSYLLSAATLIPVIALLLIYFSDFLDPPYKEIDFMSAFKIFWDKKNIRAVFIAHFTLQIFFLCMVVFTPLYLTQNIGLTWTEFGIVMFFAQLAYVIFEYPVGIIADRLIGEKEMMALGFLILSVSTAWIAFVTVANVFVWSLLMFITRTGASLVEVTTEVNFFKQTQSSDAQIISFFRITRPLAYVVGAVIASLSLLYLPFNLFFIVVALLMIPAMFLTLDIKDSK